MIAYVTVGANDITRAERTLLYLPNGVLLVHDIMEAEPPRRWEWNFHAAEPLTSADKDFAVVRNGAARCDCRAA